MTLPAALLILAAVRVATPAPAPAPLPPGAVPVPDRAAPADSILPGGDRDRGRWKLFRNPGPDPVLTEEQLARIEELESVAYTGGSLPVPSRAGVVIHQAARTAPGWNFYTSGHAPEAILMDMSGRVLHRWRREFRDVWPDREAEGDSHAAQFWRRAHLLPNGDILAIFEGLGLVKLDRDSRLIWASPVRAHHDLEVMPDGSIYVLTREARLVPRVNPREPILEDFISVLDSSGAERKRVSLLRAFESSPSRLILEEAGVVRGDIFHTNSLRVLDGRLSGSLPAFRAGNVLTSMRRLDAIAVVDLQRETVVWAHQGSYRHQHDPRVLDNGHLLLFDNGESGSRVLEIQPVTNETTWTFSGTPSQPFFSRECGTATRFPNGNTLITESDNGRAFEVTPEGETVWEFLNPFRAGAHDEFIATLFEMVRLPLDFPLGWAGD